MAGAQIATSVTILNSLLGFQAISLTNLATSAESAIAAGSKLEIAGAFFTWASAEAASGWSAISTAAIAYIAVTPSGSAGSQVAAAAYTSTAPVWSESKQGWYASAGSITRYVGGVTKTSATKYDNAFILPAEQDSSPRYISATLDGGITNTIVGTGASLRAARFNIGEWNMDATQTVQVSISPINASQVRVVNVLIRDDNDDFRGDLISWNASSSGHWRLDLLTDNNLELFRTTGGQFDNSTFDGTASTVANRGWVTVWYEE